MLNVDLATEHDAGRFDPVLGDKVYLVGAFNNWEPGEIELTDADGDWVYETNLEGLSLSVSDTLLFKFAIESEEHRDLPNAGWEIIPNRQVAIQTIKEQSPVFVFNETWSPLVTKQLSFRVNMSNQEVLGFFDPKEDKVMVLGSFLEEVDEGVEMELVNEERLIYDVSFPVEVREEDPILYSYRIMPGQDKLLPGDGLETLSVRRYADNNELDYFNNQERILRIILSEDWVKENTELEFGDRLYVTLIWNGEQSRNYRMEKNAHGSFEIAMQVPEMASDLKCIVRKNLTSTLTEIAPVEVPLDGRLVTK